MVNGQSKMERNNPRQNPRQNPPRHHVRLYCDQPSQTQPESDSEVATDSSEFGPIKIGKSMSIADAMRGNPQLLTDEEKPPQSRRRGQLKQDLDEPTWSTWSTQLHRCSTER